MENGNKNEYLPKRTKKILKKPILPRVYSTARFRVSLFPSPSPAFWPLDTVILGKEITKKRM